MEKIFTSFIPFVLIIQHVSSTSPYFYYNEVAKICILRNSYEIYSVYIVVLFWLLFGLLIATVLVLSYIIHKLKKGKYETTMVSNTTFSDARSEYLRQDSALNNESITSNTLGSIRNLGTKNESTFTIFDEKDFFVKDEPDSPKPVDLRPRPAEETRPPIKASIRRPPQETLMRAQLNEICKEVLSKMNRTDHVSLTNLEQILKDRKPAEFESLPRDVVDPMPESDDIVDYDILPRAVPIENAENGEEIYNGIYDDPTMVEQYERYRMPKPTEGPCTDYVNARNVCV